MLKLTIDDEEDFQESDTSLTYGLSKEDVFFCLLLGGGFALIAVGLSWLEYITSIPIG